MLRILISRLVSRVEKGWNGYGICCWVRVQIPVLGICDILVRIRIRIRGSVSLTN
jgi:hypothetical protein